MAAPEESIAVPANMAVFQCTPTRKASTWASSSKPTSIGGGEEEENLFLSISVVEVVDIFLSKYSSASSMGTQIKTISHYPCVIFLYDLNLQISLLRAYNIQ